MNSLEKEIYTLIYLSSIAMTPSKIIQNFDHEHSEVDIGRAMQRLIESGWLGVTEGCHLVIRKVV